MADMYWHIIVDFSQFATTPHIDKLKPKNSSATTYSIRKIWLEDKDKI